MYQGIFYLTMFIFNNLTKSMWSRFQYYFQIVTEKQHILPSLAKFTSINSDHAQSLQTMMYLIII